MEEEYEFPERVLVPLDDSPLSDKAAEYGFSVFPEAEFVLLNVIDPVTALQEGSQEDIFSSHWKEWYAKTQQHSKEVLEEAAETARDRGIDIDRRSEPGKPARKIVDLTHEEDIDQVVIGSHGRSGISRVLLGSVAETVAREADCPVTVVR